MPNLNRVQIIGRLGKDPESRTTKNGTEYAVFSVATNHYWKNRDGKRQEETNWFYVQAWGKLGEICKKYLKKGSLVYLEGRLRTESYEHEGETRYFTKVIAHRMQMLDKPEKKVEEEVVEVEDAEVEE
jgi:single-strand DNA-binding protein